METQTYTATQNFPGYQLPFRASTMDPKQDAVQTEAALYDADLELKNVAAPFEEKTEEEKRLVRKIDWYLMPTIWVLYCFSYMVR